jgi:hypothetical protein
MGFALRRDELRLFGGLIELGLASTLDSSDLAGCQEVNDGEDWEFSVELQSASLCREW